MGFSHMVVGYMRVSSDGDRQVLDLQRNALLAAAPCLSADRRHRFGLTYDFEKLCGNPIIMRTVTRCANQRPTPARPDADPHYRNANSW